MATPVSTTRGWQTLPAVLFARSASWLDGSALEAALQCCKAWNVNTKLENLFQQRYLSEFEPGTALNPSLAPEGDATSWRKRYFRRRRVEQNWNQLNFRCVNPKSESDGGQSGVSLLGLPWRRVDFQQMLLADSKNWLVAVADNFCGIFDLLDCERVALFSLRGRLTASALRDSPGLPLLLAAGTKRSIELYDLTTDDFPEYVGAIELPGTCFNSIAARGTLIAAGVTAAYHASDQRLCVFDSTTRTLLSVVDILDPAESIHFDHSGTRLLLSSAFCVSTFALQLSSEYESAVLPFALN